MTIGKYFRDKNPNNRSLPDRVRGNEGEDTNRHERKMLGKEGPCHEAERSDVAKRSDIKKRAPAQPVNQPQADKSKDEIGHANSDGLQQSGFCGKASEFEDAGREI